MAETFEATWHNLPAITLETAALRVIVVPIKGGKIVSIYDKAADHEWMVPPLPGRPFELVAYGSAFIKQDMSGWDECFPTIDACNYSVSGPYHSRLLPDHGEVWSLPWHVKSATDDALTLYVSGRALPYSFQRRIQVVDQQTLRLEYQVTNIGNAPFYTLWAAHPQFMTTRQTQIVLPPAVHEIVNVYQTPEWGAIGKKHRWPQATMSNGNAYDLSRIGPVDLKRARKFYVPADVPVDWVALQQPDKQTALRLSWDGEKVPYLGMWVDEGAISSYAVVALEPSTGYYDHLGQAIANETAPQLQPNDSLTWYLDVELSPATIL